MFSNHVGQVGRAASGRCRCWILRLSWIWPGQEVLGIKKPRVPFASSVAAKSFTNTSVDLSIAQTLEARAETWQKLYALKGHSPAIGAPQFTTAFLGLCSRQNGDFEGLSSL